MQKQFYFDQAIQFQVPQDVLLIEFWNIILYIYIILKILDQSNL